MTTGRDFLERFRPAGAPGAAGGAGVPADRAAMVAAELGPVLAQLDGVHQECEELIRAAEREAARIGEEARAASVSVAEESERQAAAARDESAREVFARASAQVQAAAQAAAQRAVGVRCLAMERMPGLVAKAVGRALAMPGSLLAAPGTGRETE